MKYIVFECTSEGHPTRHIGVTFPDLLVHQAVAEMMARVKVQPESNGRWWMWPKPVSAGFVVSGTCCGHSESLEMKCHSDDTAICFQSEQHRGLGFKERKIK